MLRPTDDGMVCSIALGFAMIANIIGTSYYNFYSIELLIGVAFAIGIAMVVGSLYFFLGEPRAKPRAFEVPEVVHYHTAIRRPMAAPA